jgi:transcriptional regulator with XRE-family HTH domain
MRETLGQTLKRARRALDLTQRELALRVGVQSSHIAYLEADRRRPSLGLLSRLGQALGLERKQLALLACPEARSFLQVKARRRRRDQAWRQFINDKALLARHGVKPRELRVLAKTNLLGAITAPRDFLFILNSIRQARDTEE